MDKNLTHLYLIFDTSGSMVAHQDAATRGANEFIRQNQLADGECRISITRFNHRVSITENPRLPFSFQPYGRTALLDAVGQTITTAGAELSSLNPEDRPGLVIVAIITDGLENASKEYTFDQVKEMVGHQEEKYGWQFAYVGGFAGAVECAEDLGVRNASRFDPRKADVAMDAVTGSVLRMRSARASGECGEVVGAAGEFTKEEKKWMK